MGRQFKLTPNTQDRILRKKDSFTNAHRRLFRAEGAGRPTDEWWIPVETNLLKRFSEQRDLGCIVHRRHLVTFVHEFCAENGINLVQEETTSKIQQKLFVAALTDSAKNLISARRKQGAKCIKNPR